MCDLFLFFLVLFASWGTSQLLHHLVVIAVCALRLTSIFFMNPTCREWRCVPASQSTSFTVVYILLRVWWWFLWFCLYIFDLQKKTRKSDTALFLFPFWHLLTNVLELSRGVWVCVVGFVGCLMTGLIIYLFQDFRVTLMCSADFRRFRVDVFINLASDISRLELGGFRTLCERPCLMNLDLYLSRKFPKHSIDGLRSDALTTMRLCVWRPLSFHFDCCLMSVLTPSHFGPSCSGSRLKSPVGVCLRPCVIDSRSLLSSTTCLLLTVCGSHRHACY